MKKWGFPEEKFVFDKLLIKVFRIKCFEMVLCWVLQGWMDLSNQGAQQNFTKTVIKMT